MKKITISLDDETHRLAKMKAFERGTSVSALVREYLNSLTEPTLRRSERTLSEVIESIRARGGGIDPAENLTRDELHDRNAFR